MIRCQACGLEYDAGARWVHRCLAPTTVVTTTLEDMARLRDRNVALEAEVRRLREALESRDKEWVTALAFGFQAEGYGQTPIVPKVEVVRECLRTRKDSKDGAK